MGCGGVGWDGLVGGGYPDARERLPGRSMMFPLGVNARHGKVVFYCTHSGAAPGDGHRKIAKNNSATCNVIIARNSLHYSHRA